MPSESKATIHLPRERLAANGPSALSVAELMALLLGTGTAGRDVQGVAHDLLSRFDLHRMSRASVGELCMHGVGEVKAARIVAAFELSRRLSSNPRAVRVRIKGPKDAVGLVGSRLRGLEQEHLEGLYLDSRGRLLASKTLAVGTLNVALVHPREVFSPALSEHAAALVLVHNHPSGEPTPSDADVEFTRLVAAAGELFGVPLLDHVIIGEDGWRSLRRLGVFKTQP